jgi:hypothetical protein
MRGAAGKPRRATWRACAPTTELNDALMPTHFFAVPDFLGLLRFWDEGRHGRPLPEWTGDPASIPDALRPNIVIADGGPDFVYRYVGAQCVRWWGSDATGRTFDSVLAGAIRDYIRSLCRDAEAHRRPIFSAAVYQADDGSTIPTGRLFAPFTPVGSADASVLISVQLFRGPERPLPAVGRGGFVHELRRDMISMVPALCARLEDASRYYRMARRTHQRDVAADMESLVRELTGSALVPLACIALPAPD